jgi:hypothetical protein
VRIVLYLGTLYREDSAVSRGSVSGSTCAT